MRPGRLSLSLPAGRIPPLVLMLIAIAGCTSAAEIAARQRAACYRMVTASGMEPERAEAYCEHEYPGPDSLAKWERELDGAKKLRRMLSDSIAWPFPKERKA
jgi:hypothetical protein